MPIQIRVIITQGTSSDCKHSIELIDNFKDGMLIANRGYDTNEIIRFALKNNMKVTIIATSPRELLDLSINLVLSNENVLITTKDLNAF